MKNLLLRFTKQNIRMIARMLIFLAVLGYFESSVYAQITGTTPGSRCGEGTVTLGATASSGTIHWYTVPFYGTSVGTGESFITPVLVVSTYYYVDAVDEHGCGICDRVSVLASINASTVTSSIFYASSTFCKTVATSQPITSTGTPGGVYTATPSGLSLSSSTGAILPSTSLENTYTVTYTVSPAPGCSEPPVSTLVTIASAQEQPTISYSGSPFCTSHASVNVVRTGAIGGTYSASPSGLTIDAGTGTITPASSSTGTYTISYLVSGAGGCTPLTATTTVTILQLPTASISYLGAPFCNSLGSQPVTLTGTGVYTGGVYSYTGSGTLSLNTSSGAILVSSSTPGTYTVTYTLAAVAPCAQVTAEASVTIYPVPTATLSGTTAICSGGTTNLSFAFTGNSPWTFTYTDGTTPVTISSTTDNPKIIGVSPIVNTTYSLSAVNDAHCIGTTSGSAAIIVSVQPVAAFSYTETPYCSNGVNPFPTFTGGGVPGTFSSTVGLSFSTSTGEVHLAASTAGTYTVRNTVTAPSGCTDAWAEATITITKLPVATFSYSQSAYCTNGIDPTATIPVGSVAGIFSSTTGLVFLNTSTGSIDLSESTAGTYTVTNTIAPANGCGQVTATFNVTITAAPVQPAISYSAASFCVTSPLQDVVQTGTPGGTYSAPAALSVNPITGQINPAASTAGGPYTVTYTIAAAGGCSVLTATFDVTMLSAPTATISYAGHPFCKSVATAQPVTLTGTAGGVYTYSGTGTLTLSSSSGAITPSSSDAGNYIVTYTIAASGGCAEVTATTPVTITATPTATISYAGSPYCKDILEAQAVTQTGTLGGTYTATPVGLVLNSSSGMVTPGSSDPGLYTVTYAIGASGGCASVETTTGVRINALPAPVITGTTPLCILSTGNIYSTPFVTGHSYLWTISGGTITAGDGTNSITVTWNDPFGWLTVQETITATGCQVTTDYFNVALNPLPTATISGTTRLCQGATAPDITFTGANGTAPYTFTYKINAGGDQTVISTGNTATVSQTTTAAGTFIYTLVSVQDASSTTCSQLQSGTATITVDPTTVAGTISGSKTVCTGTNSTTLTLNGKTGSVVKWQYSSDDFGSDIHDVANTTTTLVATDLTSTTYYRAVVQSGVCLVANSTTATITVVPDPTISSQPTATTYICAGGTATLSVTAANGTGGYVYQWEYYSGEGWGNVTNGDVVGATYSGASSSSLTIVTTFGSTGNGAYQYKCIVNASGNGCTSVTSNIATVDLKQTPQWLSISAPTPTTLCVGGTVAFSATVTSGQGGTITWIRSATSGGSGTTVTTGEAPPVGTWYYRPHYAPTGDGCTLTDGTETTVTVAADPTISVQPTATTYICAGGTATLSVTAANGTGGYVYQWEYYSGEGWGNVTNGDVVGATYSGASSSSLTIVTTFGSTGNGAYQYKCIVNASGNGCTSVTSNIATVDLKQTPQWLSISAPTPTTLCVGGTVAFSATVTSGQGGTITWIRSATSGGSGTTVTTGDAPPLGTWYYRPHYAPTGSGCTLEDGTQTTVTVVADPTIATQPAATTTICQGGSASLSVVAANGTGTFTYRWETFQGTWTNVVNGIPAGAIYTGESTATLIVSGITGTFANLWYRCVVSSSGTGCDPVTSAAANVPVVSNPTWATINSPTPVTLCVGGTVAFSASISGGAGGTISWIRSNNATPGSGTEITVTTGEAPPSGTWYYRPHCAPTGSGCTLEDGTQTTVTVKEFTDKPVITSITNEATTIVSGTSAANAAITVYKAGTTSIGTTTANGSGAWSATVSALATGDEITAKATAPGKCESAASDPLTVPAGPTAPTPQTFCGGN